MATQWGRKETVIWPAHVPDPELHSLRDGGPCTCLFIWQRLAFSLEPLPKSYITEYIRSGVGSTFKAHESYRLLYLGGAKRALRLAFPVDFDQGRLCSPPGRLSQSPSRI
jgi:hypothetical protein